MLTAAGQNTGGSVGRWWSLHVYDGIRLKVDTVDVSKGFVILVFYRHEGGDMRTIHGVWIGI